MKEMGLSCDTVTTVTETGMDISQNIFPFLSADICIQNNGRKSVKDWEGKD